MIRAVSISLVLLGGGIVTAAALHRPSDACDSARAQQRPDAEDICRTSSHARSGSHVSTYTSHSSGVATGAAIGAATAVARGGFGATGAHTSSHSSGG